MIKSLASNNIFNNCKNEAIDKFQLESSNIKFEKFKKKNSNTICGGYDYSSI